MKSIFKKITIAVIVAAFFSLPLVSRADPPGGGCDPLDPTCPIDGGITALLVLGAGYGISKIKKSSKDDKGTEL